MKIYLFFLGIVTAFICIIPLMLPSHPYNDTDRSTVSQSINTQIHSDSLLMSVTACLVLSIDGLLDYLYGSFEKNSFERWFLLSSLLFPNLVLFIALNFSPQLSPGLLSSPSLDLLHALLIELFTVMTACREILLQSSLMSFFVTLSTNPEFFSWSLFTQVSFNFAVMIFLFDNFFYLPVFFLYLAYCSIISSAVLILWRLFKLLTTISTPTISAEISERSIYIFCLIFNIFGRFIIFVALRAAHLPRGDRSSLYNCVDIITVLIIVSVSGRKIREDYLGSKVNFPPYPLRDDPPLFLPSLCHSVDSIGEEESFCEVHLSRNPNSFEHNLPRHKVSS
jgi:hypothetical protein